MLTGRYILNGHSQRQSSLKDFLSGRSLCTEQRGQAIAFQPQVSLRARRTCSNIDDDSHERGSRMHLELILKFIVCATAGMNRRQDIPAESLLESSSPLRHESGRSS